MLTVTLVVMLLYGQALAVITDGIMTPAVGGVVVACSANLMACACHMCLTCGCHVYRGRERNTVEVFNEPTVASTATTAGSSASGHVVAVSSSSSSSGVRKGPGGRWVSSVVNVCCSRCHWLCTSEANEGKAGEGS